VRLERVACARSRQQLWRAFESLTAEAASSAASECIAACHRNTPLERASLAASFIFTIRSRYHCIARATHPCCELCDQVLARARNGATHGALGPAPEAADGGDLLSLIELLRWSGDSLWVSIEHGDGNPLWEVCWTLLSALATALFPRGDRYDPFPPIAPMTAFIPY